MLKYYEIWMYVLKFREILVKHHLVYLLDTFKVENNVCWKNNNASLLCLYETVFGILPNLHLRKEFLCEQP